MFNFLKMDSLLFRKLVEKMCIYIMLIKIHLPFYIIVIQELITTQLKKVLYFLMINNKL